MFKNNKFFISPCLQGLSDKLIVLNTKQPLSNILSFGCFQRNSEVNFFLSEKLVRTDKSKIWHNLEFFYLILALGVLKIWVSGLRHNLGCARYAQSFFFFQTFKIQHFSCFITLSPHIKNIAVAFLLAE